MMLAQTTPQRAAESFAELSRECQRACLETARHCQLLGGDTALPLGMHVFQACSRACRMSLAALTIGSQLTQQLLLACHAVCVKSARACAEMLDAAGDDEQFESCAAACLDCAAACESLLDAAAEPADAGTAWRVRITSAAAVPA